MKNSSNKLTLIAVACVSLILALGALLFLNRPPRMNVLLIVVDTLRADHLSCYGWPELSTPNIDRLAEEGIVVEKMICQVPQTLPSFCTSLTGTYPMTHGVRANGIFALPDEALTLPEIFSSDGYRTAAFLAGFPLDRLFGTDQGFDTYNDSMRSDIVMEGLKKNDDGSFHWLGHSTESFENRADMVTADAITWFKKSKEGGFFEKRKPFFMMVHYFDPHHNYAPPDRFRSFQHPYTGEVAFVDEQVGALLSSLRSLDLDRNTLVVFTADHGECLGEQGRYTHQTHVADAAIHVPFIIRIPGDPTAAARVAGLCRSVDILPTILEVAGLSVPRSTEGNSLLDGFRSGELPEVEGYFETCWGRLEGKTGVTRQGLLSGQWKLVHNWKEAEDGDRPEEYFELFDLKKDPLERNNLAPTHLDELRKLRFLLEDFLKAHPSKRAKVITPDDAAREKLEKLGYS